MKSQRYRRKLDANWTPAMSKALFELQDKCVLCESESDLSLDHLLPLARGNPLKPGNAVVLCRVCNGWKSSRNLNKLPIEIRNKLLKAAQEFYDYYHTLNTSLLKFW